MSFTGNLSNKHGKQFLDTATKTGLDALKTASRKVVHKAVEATGEFIGSKIADKIVKQKPLVNENLRNVEEMIILPEKREEMEQKWNIIEYLNYLTIQMYQSL